MKKKKRGFGGYLTVFLTLCLTCMVSLCLILIRGVYSNSVKTESQIVVDIGMNSILAEYHRELFEKYDLFFVDTSYGTILPSPALTCEHLREYLNKNISGKDLFLNFIYRDLLRMQVGDVEIEKICIITDEDGKVLRRQAVDYMYDKLGLTVVEEVLGWFDLVNQYTVDFHQLEKMRLQTADNLEALYEGQSFSEEAGWQEGIYQNVISQRDNNWLDLCMLIFSDNIGEISQNQVDLNQYISHREANKGSGMNPAINYSEGMTEKILFQEYLMEKTGNYRNPAKDSPLQYEAEYLISGQASDMENFAIVLAELLLVRQAANLTCLLSDTVKMELVRELSALVAALLENPGCEPWIRSALVLGWSFAESVYDVRALVEGGKVPLIKTEEQWFLDIKQVLGVGLYLLDTELLYDEGLSYEHYLRILLLFQDNSIKTKRFMDIVEMNIRQTPGNANFRIDGCADGFQFHIGIYTRNGRYYKIKRWCGYY